MRGLVLVSVLVGVVLLLNHLAAGPPSCPSIGAPGPATLTDGPVSLSTNQSVYSQDAPLQVTITNHLTQSVWVMEPFEFAGDPCPLFVDVWQRGQWVRHLCEVTGDVRTSIPVLHFELPAGAAQVFTGTARFYGLPPGTYRAGYSYSLVSPETILSYYGELGIGVDFLRAATPLMSQPFRVCTCGHCAP
jgi:hypothetical protein